MDWKVLSKVLFQVFGGIALVMAFFILLALSIEWLGIWTLLIIPGYLLYYVIKNMYHDELVRQGKRMH